ncbi:aromatic amino acid aminotransferase [Diplodia corticola]|uniref:Aspartate aminotransferase n=1 Tax=Diplodia corticola TaxID=236234 RepID=A0A1J9S6K9_9PEZI|nr:aromatic amino acid aminotransferase [Diplodia corticola]OJD35580.1 aromatic amino acid aminotransferase [Diplodia corticola]
MGSISETSEAFPSIPPDDARDIMWDLKLRLSADKTPDKVDLGAGVYRDEESKYYELPVVRKVNGKRTDEANARHADRRFTPPQAKKILAAQPVDHGYGFNTGDPAFLHKAAQVIFGKDNPILQTGRVSSIQTIGGTGACHLGAVFTSHFFRPAAPSSPSSPPTPLHAYIGDPAWPNYGPLLTHAGLTPVFYPYHDPSTHRIAFDALLSAIAAAPPRSVFVLQAVCHNPTGLDLSREQWRAAAQALRARGHLPFFDIAYQGFGAGLDDDAWPVREFVAAGLEVVVAQSFSKNLGLYGERVGVVHVVVGDEQTAVRVGERLRGFARWTWASPPRGYAKVGDVVLGEFWDEWLENLREMRERLQKNRKNLHWWLTEQLKTPGSWDHILEEAGLFSLLGLDESQVLRIAEEDHIHFPITGRINVAGLTETNVERLARAVDKVVR